HEARRESHAHRLTEPCDAKHACVPHVVDRVLPLLLCLVRYRAPNVGGPRRVIAHEGPNWLVHHWIRSRDDLRAAVGGMAVRPHRTTAYLYVAAGHWLGTSDGHWAGPQLRDVSRISRI